MELIAIAAVMTMQTTATGGAIFLDRWNRCVTHFAEHHGQRIGLYTALVVTVSLLVQLFGVPWTWV